MENYGNQHHSTSFDDALRSIMKSLVPIEKTSILEDYIVEAIIIESKFLSRKDQDRERIAKRVSEIIQNGEVSEIAHNVTRGIDLLHADLRMIWENREGGFVQAFAAISDILSDGLKK